MTKEEIKEYFSKYNMIKAKIQSLDLEIAEHELMGNEKKAKAIELEVKLLNLKIRRIDNFLSMLDEHSKEKDIFKEVIINKKSKIYTAELFKVSRKTVNRKVNEALTKIEQIGN
ncbi:MAG: hypothetical protein ACRC7N_19785 [Clostridium sp.]